LSNWQASRIVKNKHASYDLRSVDAVIGVVYWHLKCSDAQSLLKHSLNRDSIYLQKNSWFMKLYRDFNNVWCYRTWFNSTWHEFLSSDKYEM